jgi:hypothetical protein
LWEPAHRRTDEQRLYVQIFGIEQLKVFMAFEQCKYRVTSSDRALDCREKWQAAYNIAIALTIHEEDSAAKR